MDLVELIGNGIYAACASQIVDEATAKEAARVALVAMRKAEFGLQVFCVLCIDDERRQTTHLFSTQEAAQAYADADPRRSHVLYDYLIDFPEHMEDMAQ